MVPYGLGWLGIHSLNVVLLKNLIDNSGAMRTCLNYGVRMSFHEWHNNRLENVIGVPFHTQVCPPHVWLRGLSLWMTWPRPIFDTISLFVFRLTSMQIWYCCCGHLDTWNSSGNSFQRSSRFQVPNEAQSCSSTNSVSHSKIKPLCKLIFCFHYVERHLHINGKWSIFATFTFAPWNRKMYVFSHA